MKKEATVDKSRKSLIKKITMAGIAFLICILGYIIIKNSIENKKEAEYLNSYGKTAVQIGSYSVPFDVYRTLYLNHKEENKARYTVNGTVNTAALHAECRRLTGEQLKTLYGTVALAANYGLSPSDNDIKIAVDEFYSQFKSNVNYKKELAKYNMTENAFLTLEAIGRLDGKLFTALVNEIGMIENDDDKILEILKSDDFICTTHIFIERGNDDEIEENRNLALSVLDDLERGISFNSVRVHSDVPPPKDGYYFTKGEMQKEYELAAFALEESKPEGADSSYKLNNISGLVETAEGFYIIMRLPKDEQYISNNFSTLKSRYQNATFYNLINDYATRMSFTESDYLLSLSYEDIK